MELQIIRRLIDGSMSEFLLEMTDPCPPGFGGKKGKMPVKAVQAHSVLTRGKGVTIHEGNPDLSSTLS